MAKANVLTREFIEDRVMMLPDLPGCWIWTGYCNRTGYGKINVGGKKMLAHRASFIAFHGEAGAAYIRHSCDNPCCVNPDHLKPGTQADNMADMVRRGRSATGDRNGHRKKPWATARGDRHGSRTKPELLLRGSKKVNAKLTDDAVRAIRASRDLLKVDAARYGVSIRLVSMVRRRLRWAHVE